MDFTPQEKIEIFKNIFRGREDVFAVYWERADKTASGYTPACLNEWKPELCYKIQKRKCKDWYTGKHEPIITQELFEKAKTQLKRDQDI